MGVRYPNTGDYRLLMYTYTCCNASSYDKTRFSETQKGVRRPTHAYPPNSRYN